jgi:hypothetical protein
MKFSLINSLLIIFLSFILMSGGCSPDIEDIEPDPEPPTEDPWSPDPYKPENASDIPRDVKIYTSSATASEHQPGEDISKALDGNFNTLYHSRWNQTLFPDVPVVIDFFFPEDVTGIDYMLYHPRKDGGVNGFILETEVWLKERGQDDFEKFGVLEFANNSSTKRIFFTDGFENPDAIKLAATKGNNDFISASQFEFFSLSDASEAYSEFFTDLSFSELREDVSRESLETIDNSFIRNMALAIFDEVYESERTGIYKTYPDPAIISSQNKTNRMGSYDNMTGIHVKWGEDIVVFVDELITDMVLRIVNHHEGYGGQDFFLNPGPNRIISPSNGLVYLIYNSQTEHEAKVNIASGTINGYFDLNKHSQEDWEKLISDASYSFFDLKGNKAHITFTTHELRQYVTNAPRLVEVYDSIVLLQQELMGLYKYDRVPAGRLYYRTNTSPGVYMHATGNATEYAPSTLVHIANHESLRGDNIWGPAHETGHIHQTRPGLMWIGMTEVSVNIYSQHVQTSFGNPSRLQTENISGYENRYEKAFNEIIAAGLPHGAHTDVFCKLVPFWQLQLYFAKVRGYKDFYKDVHEQIRIKPNPPTDGLCQLEFVKTVCYVAQLNMLEFFQAWGFLTPIDQDINDYGVRRLTVTQEQIDDVINYINQQGYPAPPAEVHYITDNTVNDFK